MRYETLDAMKKKPVKPYWSNACPLLAEGKGFRPEYDGPEDTWAIYVIDLGAPSKSGFLAERAQAMWKKPSFCKTLTGAYVKHATEEEIIDLCLKKRETMNKRLMLIPISVQEIRYVQEHRYPALPYDNPAKTRKKLERTGKMQFFD